MVRVEDAVIARLESSGEKFEVLVDPDLALKLKQGHVVSFHDLVVIDTVFSDAKKGKEQSPAALNKVFGTTDVETIVKKIILTGEVQLTTEQRRELREKKRREVIDLIARNAVNPQTGFPHPPLRIQTALEEAKIGIDEWKPASEQLQGILKELRKLLPISMEKLQVAVKIPPAFAGKANARLHHYEVRKQEWQNDGSLILVLDIPAGLKGQLFDELNHLTHGQVETKVIGTEK